METVAPLWLWATFVAIVLVSLFVDFVVLKKQGAHDIGVKEALNWSLDLDCAELPVQRFVLVRHQRQRQDQWSWPTPSRWSSSPVT
jgi:hypothetical protein